MENISQIALFIFGEEGELGVEGEHRGGEGGAAIGGDEGSGDGADLPEVVGSFVVEGFGEDGVEVGEVQQRLERGAGADFEGASPEFDGLEGERLQIGNGEVPRVGGVQHGSAAEGEGERFGSGDQFEGVVHGLGAVVFKDHDLLTPKRHFKRARSVSIVFTESLVSVFVVCSPG